MLSHKVEKYLKTGEQQYLNEIKSTIAQADAKDINQIYKTINSTLNATDDKRSRVSMVGMGLGIYESEKRTYKIN